MPVNSVFGRRQGCEPWRRRISIILDRIGFQSQNPPPDFRIQHFQGRRQISPPPFLLTSLAAARECSQRLLAICVLLG
jgi:hypothetical protein